MASLVLLTIISLQQSAEKPVDAPTERAQAGQVEISEVAYPFYSEEAVRQEFDAEINKPAYKRMRTKIKRFNLGKYDTPTLQSPGWWSRFWTWVGSWFQATPGGAKATPSTFAFGGFGGGTLLVWIVVGLFLAVVVAYLVKAASVRVADGSNRKRLASDLESDAIAPSTPPGEVPSDEYMHHAIQLAKTGDHRRALRQLVLGGMSWIERAGLIRFRKGLTNRDYVRAVYRRDEQRKRFSEIILNFERVYFGRREANEEQFQDCLSEYKTAFGRMIDAETAVKEQEALLAKQQATKQEQQVTVVQPQSEPDSAGVEQADKGFES
ncbi:MAG: DUF4129 domain-containing protein [Planctomycetaceae bacterium]